MLARFHQAVRFFCALERKNGVDDGADASGLEIGAEAFQEGVDDGGFLFDGTRAKCGAEDLRALS